MKKNEIVKSNRDFDLIIKKEKYIKNNEFIIYYVDNQLEYNRFGISVGKKIGKAIVRNYYKRIIRNMCDMNKNLYSNGKDYIIIMRKGLIFKNFQKANESFRDLLEKINQRKGQ